MTTPTRVSIRPATGDERDAVQALWDEAGLGRAAPDEWAALISGDTSAVLVAEDGGELLGTAIASFDGWRAYIYHVAVGSGHRRQGIAHALLQEASNYLLSAGARQVFVTVNEANTEALALVASEGFLPDGEIVLGRRLATRFT